MSDNPPHSQALNVLLSVLLNVLFPGLECVGQAASECEEAEDANLLGSEQGEKYDF